MNTNTIDQSDTKAAILDQQPKLAVSYFLIEGLNCPRCAERVRIALLRAPGVSNAIVEYPDGLAEVTYNSAQVTVDGLTLVVQAAGDGGHHNYSAKALAL